MNLAHATFGDTEYLAHLAQREVLDVEQDRHPALARALAESAACAGAGSGASHLITGHGAEHARLEEELAAFTRRERALLFSTGYMANLAVITALAGRGERVLLDRLCHASLIDGARLSGATLVRYAHAAVDEAARLAAADPGHTVLLATDGVFSMDGDLAPLPALARCARAHDLWLVVDDAHGLGVIGASGGGVLEHYGLGSEAVPVLVGTLGKAFGSFGAFVAGASTVIGRPVSAVRPCPCNSTAITCRFAARGSSSDPKLRSIVSRPPRVSTSTLLSSRPR